MFAGRRQRWWTIVGFDQPGVGEVCPSPPQPDRKGGHSYAAQAARSARHGGLGMGSGWAASMAVSAILRPNMAEGACVTSPFVGERARPGAERTPGSSS